MSTTGIVTEQRTASIFAAHGSSNQTRTSPSEAGQEGAARGLQRPQCPVQLLGPQLLLQGAQRRGLAAPEVQLRRGSRLLPGILPITQQNSCAH